jgi:16S rRNA G966 N2-methylase RsmD
MTYDEIIQVPCTILKALPEPEINSIINTIIDHYYANGFPYYQIDTEKIKKEVLSLSNFDVDRLELPDNNLQQFMLGLNTVNTFHPEMWITRCRNAKTPMDVFMDRELFKVALRKRIKYSDTKMVAFNIRKSLKAFGVQAVSNFRPTIAKWVYEKFSPSGGRVLDPCAGYGGRLMGAMCSHVGSYIGIDPNEVSVNGNYKLAMAIQRVSKKEIPFVTILPQPFEEFVSTEKYDLVFTSPPYFNIEKYSEDESQSYIRYKTYDIWVEKFLKVLIKNSKEFLKPNGYFALNVGGILIKDTLSIGNETFGCEPTIYHMRLSKILGQGNKSETSHKTEPVFVWRNN